MSYKNPSPKYRSHLATRVRTATAAVAACFVISPALSNPVNPVVVNGTASFNQAGSVLTVTNSNGAIINWDKFSIQAGETTHFAQTAASSSVLNRVLNDPTAIYGTLSSNGRVWLVNPAGIMVGPGGRVDTAAFVATLGVRNEDFLAGRHLFVNDGSAQSIINQGEIRTPAGGSVYLIGSNVTNEGIISTPGGETILAAGATVSLIDSATPGVKVDITGAAGNATNLGTITAEAGRIGIAGVIVRNSGTLNASSVVSEGGRVFLRASQDAYVDGNGRIVTTGTKGGSVEVLGNRVAVMDNAEIDASGSNGGGRIMVGGDWQGKNPDIQNASISYFGPDARLKADATEVGAGGTVIVWADDTTRAYGNISATGGATGGNGGLVETSGHRYLDIAGARVDTRAANGQTGNWLLDPVDVTIIQYGGMPTSGSAPFAPTSNNSVIYAEDISAALGTTGVTIQTDGGTGGVGNITVTNANIYGGGSNGLSLLAYGSGGATGNIDINGSTVELNAGALTLVAGWSGTGTNLAVSDGADGSIAITDSSLRAGAVLMKADGDIFATGLNKGAGVESSGTMDVQASNIYLTGGSNFGQDPFMPNAGAGVWLKSAGAQTVEAAFNIVLQAGSANNTYGGGSMYGGSVGIVSDASQTISANVIRVLGGVSGHDNEAGIQAYGGQSITITGTNGLLEVMGGGNAGSYNNQARIQHGQWVSNDSYTGTDDQTITINGGGSVNVVAGSGTGVLGYYGSDCVASGAAIADCRGGSNGAQIENGIGVQTLAFVADGSLAVTGGSNGTNNWAGIGNKGTDQYVTGNPDIILTGGSGGGGAVSYGGEVFHLSNDAGIFSKGSGVQDINAGALTIYGGSATWGGAGISNESGQPLNIHATGNLSMYGGSSGAGDPFASAVYIGSETAGQITVDVGGDIYIKSGSTVGGAVMIGSIGSTANVSISSDVGRDITIIADVGAVGIGSQKTGFGAGVTINSGRDLSTSGSGGVMIGSEFDSLSQTNVTLNARRDISLGSSTLIGVDEPSGASGAIRLVAGWDGVDTVAGLPNASAGYGSVIAGGASFRSGGGSFSAFASDNITLGSVNTDGVAGNSAGDVLVTANNGTLEVASISAKGADAEAWSDSDGGFGGNVTLQSYGDLTLGVGGIDASGGKGSDSSGTYDEGSLGGNGGSVTLASQTGNIAVNGSITASGGDGGRGSDVIDAYYYGYAGLGGIGGDGGQVTIASYGGDVTLNGSIVANGGTGGAGTGGGSNGYGYGDGGNGGAGGQVTITSSIGGVVVNGSILANGGTGGAGGDGGEGGNGGAGGGGGQVEITSSGNLTVGGSIEAKGGLGGDGGTGYERTVTGGGSAYGNTGGQGGNGGEGGIILLTSTAGNVTVSNGISVTARGGDGGTGHEWTVTGGGSAYGNTGGQGGNGGEGGSILLTSTAGNVTVSNGISVTARGGDGGQGGVGGVGRAYGYSGYGGVSNGYGDGGEGGQGGDGGGNGSINLSAVAGGIVIGSAASLVADGGTGGQGGIGGAGYGFGASSEYGAAIGYAWGGSGGSGGIGGIGGGIELLGGTGHIVINGGAQLRARGGQGGAGGVGSSAFVDGVNQGVDYQGYTGDSGDGGNYYWSAGHISLTSYGDIAFSGTLDTRGGIGGSGAYSGYAGPGGSVVIIAGSDGMGGTNGTYGSIVGSNDSVFTGGGSFTAYAGAGITLGSINTDGIDRYYGYSGGNVDIMAASGSLTIASISARGGDALGQSYWGASNGGSGGNVNLQSYGNLTVGSGGIDLRGGSGGPGWDGAEGNGGGIGGMGGQAMLTSLNGGIAVNGSIVAGGGQGGTGGSDYYDSGLDGGNGGTGGIVFLTAQSGIQFSNAAAFVNGGAGGVGGTGVVYGGQPGADGGGGIAQFVSYGGVAGSPAIRASVVGSDSLSATASGTYGGISISNSGLQPSSLSIDDSATSYQSSISFFNSGDLTLDGSQTFSTGSYGGTQIGSGGVLTVAVGMNGYDVNLGGTTLNVNALVAAENNIALGGSTININAGGSVLAGNNVALLAPLTGGTINLMGGVTAEGLAATPTSITASNGGTVAFTGIGFVAGNLFADAGGFLKATNTTIGNISGLVTGNITLDNGAYFDAAKDVDLVLAGGNSTLSLLNGGYILASPTTIKLAFSNRSSGGMVISGDGGLFVGSIGNVATAGNGLVLAYGATSVVVDPCVSNPLLCKPAEQKPPTQSDAPSIDTGKPDPNKPLVDANSTTGGGEDTFGDETKDEKDKDKEDKQSDQAKDEKKDEKPAQKKVAQCT